MQNKKKNCEKSTWLNFLYLIGTLNMSYSILHKTTKNTIYQLIPIVPKFQRGFTIFVSQNETNVSQNVLMWRILHFVYALACYWQKIIKLHETIAFFMIFLIRRRGKFFDRAAYYVFYDNWLQITCYDYGWSIPSSSRVKANQKVSCVSGGATTMLIIGLLVGGLILICIIGIVAEVILIRPKLIQKIFHFYNKSFITIISSDFVIFVSNICLHF